MKLTVTLQNSAGFEGLLRKLGSPAIAKAAAQGLSEHAHEQRRQSVTRLAGSTGVPKGRVAGVTRVRVGRGNSMSAQIELRDEAVGLEEYGGPHWVRDLNPFKYGHRGGEVSSMAGVEATAWNRRRVHRGTFFAQGVVWKRQPNGHLRKMFSTVLANELAKPGWKNSEQAKAFMALDLERRVVRHVMRVASTR